MTNNLLATTLRDELLPGISALIILVLITIVVLFVVTVTDNVWALSVSSRGDNKLDVFYRSTINDRDYAYWQKEWNNGWLAPNMVTDPVTARAFAEPSDAHDTVYPVTQVSSVSVPATNRIDIVSSTSENAGDQTNPTSVFEPLEIAGNLIYERSEDGGETWSGWRNLGGKILGVPTITAWAPNRLDIFAIGLNYALFHMKSEDHGETWSKWEQIGGRFGSSPAAISREGRIDIIGISRNGEDMLHYWGNGNDNKWSSESLGHGRIPSASPALNHTDFLNTHWEGKPAITSWAPDRFDIFAKGSNGVLYHKYWNGGPSWSPWLTFPYDSRGGCSTCYSSYFRIGSPAAVSWGNNRIDLFVWTDIIIPSLESGKDLYRNNVLLHTYWDGIKWRFPFEELHTTVYSEPLDIGFPNANASEPS